MWRGVNSFSPLLPPPNHLLYLLRQEVESSPKEITPFITFVLGGPGSGEGKQRLRIVETYGFAHRSVGDLLRKEITKNNENGAMILDTISKGKK